MVSEEQRAWMASSTARWELEERFPQLVDEDADDVVRQRSSRRVCPPDEHAQRGFWIWNPEAQLGVRVSCRVCGGELVKQDFVCVTVADLCNQGYVATPRYTCKEHGACTALRVKLKPEAELHCPVILVGKQWLSKRFYKFLIDLKSCGMNNVNNASAVAEMHSKKRLKVVKQWQRRLETHGKQLYQDPGSQNVGIDADAQVGSEAWKLSKETSSLLEKVSWSLNRDISARRVAGTSSAIENSDHHLHNFEKDKCDGATVTPLTTSNQIQQLQGSVKTKKVLQAAEPYSSSSTGTKQAQAFEEGVDSYVSLSETPFGAKAYLAATRRDEAAILAKLSSAGYTPSQKSSSSKVVKRRKLEGEKDIGIVVAGKKTTQSTPILSPKRTTMSGRKSVAPEKSLTAMYLNQNTFDGVDPSKQALKPLVSVFERAESCSNQSRAHLAVEENQRHRLIKHLRLKEMQRWKAFDEGLAKARQLRDRERQNVRQRELAQIEANPEQYMKHQESLASN